MKKLPTSSFLQASSSPLNYLEPPLNYLGPPLNYLEPPLDYVGASLELRAPSPLTYLGHHLNYLRQRLNYVGLPNKLMGGRCVLPVCDTCVTTRRPMSSRATAPRVPRPWLYIRVVADVTRMPL